MAAGVPGAELIPDTSELFLGFTSTQKAGMGPGLIANFETLGYVDFRGSDYFLDGTHMHLSHIQEDIESWYLNFDFDERVATAFRPNLTVKPDVQTVRAGAARRLRQRGGAARLPERAPDRAQRVDPDDVTAPAGRRRGRRHRLPERLGGAASAPTSTRSTTRSPGRSGADEIGATPAAGVHFVVFNPTGDDFRRNRLAMDGVIPGGKIPLPPRDRTRASTPSCRRRTGRTSSCRRAGTAASRSPSCEGR